MLRRWIKKYIPFAVSVAATIAVITVMGCAQLDLSRLLGKRAALQPQLQQKYLYDALVFEIAPIDGCSPDPAALAHFKSNLERFRICRAEAVVFFIQPECPPPPGFPIWTYGSIALYEDVVREFHDNDPSDRVGIIFVSYITGPVLKAGGKIGALGGLQYSDTAFAIWKDGSKLREAGVLLHEMGHLIGVKEDAKDPKYHCSDENCVLWTSTGSPYAVFCDDCQEELAAIIEARWRK